MSTAFLTDLSKAFDSLKHDLLFANLHAFGSNYKSPRVIYTYLSHRVQVTIDGSFYSKTLDIIFGVLQGSILGLLVNINIINFFLIDHCKLDFSNYVANTNLYFCGNTLLEPYQTW